MSYDITLLVLLLRVDLLGSMATDKIALPIPTVHKITRIRSAKVCKGVFCPLFVRAGVAAHGALQLLDIDPSAVDAVAGAEDLVDVGDEAVESVLWWFRGATG